MQRLALLTSSILTATLALTACGGGDSSSPSDTPSQPTKPTVVPTPPVDNKPVVIEKNTLSGLVTDANNNPLAGATVVLGKNTVITNQSGTYKFSLKDALANKIDTSTLMIKKPGYSTLVKEIPFITNQAYKLDIALAKDQISTVFETSSRIAGNLESEASVGISFDSVVDSKGQPYNGSANLAASYYGPDSIAGNRIFTQSSSGQRQNGSRVTDLANVGMIEVKLTDTMGNDLGLAENRTATLIFPGASTDQSLQTIPLWYYDKEKALWIEEGIAERLTGDGYEGNYAADVSRLGLWSLSVPLDQNSALIEGCVVDSESNEPTSQFNLLIGGRGFETYSRPNSKGKFSIAVPIDTPVLLSPVEHQVDFKEVRIPALARNEVYNIDNGQCIVTSQNKAKGLVDLNAQNKAFLDQLATLPAVTKPKVTSLTFQRPLTMPAPKENISLVGYQFDLIGELAISDIIIKDIESYVDPKNNKYNSTTYLLQSLYANNNDKYVKDYEYWSKTIITPKELLASSAQGATYPGPYLEDTNGDDPDIAAIIQYDTIFSNNQLIRNFYDKLLVVNSYRDQPLTNQKISDVLFYGAPKTPANVNIINTLNRLPASISTFDSTAACKILTARTTDVDYIEYERVIGSPQNNYADIKPPLVNAIKGSWFQENPIKWSAEKATNAAGISRAVVSYDGISYEDGIYVRADTLTVTPTEKQQCDIYNKAAKNQILEALSKVTLPYK
ncbi:carboxypeptidase-like regulatory domain-containing protein [uncultured Psychrobacter sp.]|uniref:carboxypeptidase-like regulatory domain-containing protein n=1 Tax=uncultured Psychrobacter sp. TaxID=259303 RepID=UPI0034576A8A